MSPVLAAVTAFNLVCSGTTFIGDVKKENQSAYAATFRIDLNAKRWCVGQCETTSPIFGISSTQIILKLEEDKNSGYESFISLNRENGAILDRTKIDYKPFIMQSGKCERAPFTGFPAIKF